MSEAEFGGWLAYHAAKAKRQEGGKDGIRKKPR
jgi:hypothetical protein